MSNQFNITVTGSADGEDNLIITAQASSMNKIVVDADTYPDFANFVGCWTFDDNSNAIEGVIYKLAE